MDSVLRAARQGDVAAQQRLVEQTSTFLRRYVDRRMGNHLRRHASAADILQEIYARVLRSLSSLPEDASTRTFRGRLCRHANWVLANHGILAGRLRGESAGGGGRVDETPDSAHERTGAVTRNDQVRWLRTLVGRLHPKYAQVVELRLDGLSFADIGIRLGATEQTVRQRFSRVCRALREHGAGD